MPPIMIKFGKLRKGRHIGHSIQKHLTDEMIHLVLDTDRIETGRFEIHGFAITIQCLNSYDCRPRDLSP